MLPSARTIPDATILLLRHVRGTVCTLAPLALDSATASSLSPFKLVCEVSSLQSVAGTASAMMRCPSSWLAHVTLAARSASQFRNGLHCFRIETSHAV